MSEVEEYKPFPDFDLIYPALGNGLFGEVHKARSRHKHDRIVVIKRVLGLESPESKEYAKMESGVFKELRKCPHFVTLICHEERCGYLHIMMEYCNLGNLQQYLIHQLEKGKLNYEMKYNIMVQLLYAVSMLHGLNIIHGDIKPQNILFKRVNRVDILKIADVGFSKAFSEKITDVKEKVTFYGTDTFMAPEVFYEPMQYTCSIDTFACGLVMKTVHLFDSEHKDLVTFEDGRMLERMILHPEANCTVLESSSTSTFVQERIVSLVQAMTRADPIYRATSMEGCYQVVLIKGFLSDRDKEIYESESISDQTGTSGLTPAIPEKRSRVLHTALMTYKHKMEAFIEEQEQLSMKPSSQIELFTYSCRVIQALHKRIAEETACDLEEEFEDQVSTYFDTAKASNNELWKKYRKSAVEKHLLEFVYYLEGGGSDENEIKQVLLTNGTAFLQQCNKADDLQEAFQHYLDSAKDIASCFAVTLNDSQLHMILQIVISSKEVQKLAAGLAVGFALDCAIGYAIAGIPGILGLKAVGFIIDTISQRRLQRIIEAGRQKVQNRCTGDLIGEKDTSRPCVVAPSTEVIQTEASKSAVAMSSQREAVTSCKEVKQVDDTMDTEQELFDITVEDDDTGDADSDGWELL